MRQSFVRLLTSAGLLLTALLAVACGSGQTPDAETIDESVVIEAPAPTSSWRERFRRAPGSPAPRSPVVGVRTFSTEERRATAADKKRAKELFMEGATLFDEGRYAEAAAKFLGAHELVPGAVPLYKASLCLERADDIAGACGAARGAVVMFERNPSSAGARLEDTKKRIETLLCP